MSLDQLLPAHGVGEPRPHFSGIAEMFNHAVGTASETIALIHRGNGLTYAEQGRAVMALARKVAEIATPGEVVALLLPNSPAFAVAYFAAVKALVVPALLNPLYPVPQLEPLLREVTPRVLICGPETVELAHDLGIPSVVCIDEASIAELYQPP